MAKRMEGQVREQPEIIGLASWRSCKLRAFSSKCPAQKLRNEQAVIRTCTRPRESAPRLQQAARVRVGIMLKALSPKTKVLCVALFLLAFVAISAAITMQESEQYKA